MDSRKTDFGRMKMDGNLDILGLARPGNCKEKTACPIMQIPLNHICSAEHFAYSGGHSREAGLSAYGRGCASTRRAYSCWTKRCAALKS